jgi:hypothetical protein
MKSEMNTDTKPTPTWKVCKTFNSALLEDEEEGERLNEILCASTDEAECLVDLLNKMNNEVASYKYDRQKNCPHCNAFSLGENCNCCDSRTFECGTDVLENGTCRSAECYEREISSLSRVVENLQEILKDIRESV